MAAVASIEVDGISGQQPSHHRGDWRDSGLKQDVGMV